MLNLHLCWMQLLRLGMLWYTSSYETKNIAIPWTVQGGTPNLLSPFCWYHHLFPGEPEGPMALQVDKLATTSRSCQTFPAWRFKYTAGSETLGRGFGGARDDLGHGQRQGSKHPRNYEPKIIHQCILLFQGILCILA